MRKLCFPTASLTASMEAHQLIESLLFVAAEPATVAQLARALELPADAVEAGLARLSAECAGRGVRVQRHGEHVQLVSAPEAAATVARFLGIESSSRLSAAALEVLAIIAYRQPLTRAQIEAVRGVDSSGVVRALLETSGLQPLAGTAGTVFAASVGGMAGQVATPN